MSFCETLLRTILLFNAERLKNELMCSDMEWCLLSVDEGPDLDSDAWMGGDWLTPRTRTAIVLVSEEDSEPIFFSPAFVNN